MRTAWRQAPLKRLVTYLSRGSAPAYADSETNVGILNQACVQTEGRLQLDRIRWQEPFADPASLRGALRRGDVLVNSTGTGTLGRAALFDFEGTFIADGHLTVVRPDPAQLDSRFLAYRLGNSAFFRLANEALYVGATNQTELNREALAGLPMNIPSLAEQRAIADFLDAETARIDALIAKKQQMTGLLDSRWASVLATVMPGERTPMTVLKRVARLAAGGTPSTHDPSLWSEDGLPWVAIGDMSMGALVNETARRVSPQGVAAARLRPGEPGTVLFAMYASVGAVSRLGVRACWNQAILGVSPVHGVTSGPFIDYWLRSLRQGLAQLFRSNTQDNLNAEQVASLPFPALGVGTQAQIVAKLDRVSRVHRELAKKLERQIDLLREHREALITAATTGDLAIP